MSCAACREAVSAGLDGESPGRPQRSVDEHLAGCPACRNWAEAAAEVTRRARLTPVAAVPDVTAAVLGRLPATAPVPAPAAGARRRWLDTVVRFALLVVGAGQLAVSLPALGGTGTGMSAPVHLAHETGAWNLGLAACFLGVAVLPRLATGSLPFLLPFTAVLTWVTVADLGAGHVHAGRAVGHLLLLAGAVLVSVLALRSRTRPTGPVGRAREWPQRLVPAVDEPAWGAADDDARADWPRDATASAGERRAA
ncbi:zf-HC2 domain-containing protein [uncultured Modestobacter sp.]|uniref:zf-HC2 domain-containing protein n=1 Tax=uncultured Modestobacter sp. TaxID=380048 RepID=UPI00261EEF11|nr:zf-HC2 domain-containing protein [uncultured Modestobacter sp.]